MTDADKPFRHPRDVQLARRALIDAMLIGVAIAQSEDVDLLREKLKPQDMMTVTGQHMMEAIFANDKKRFAKLMSRRYGVASSEGKRMVHHLIRHVLKSNALVAALDMNELLLVELRRANSLLDVEERWAEGLQALRRVLETEKDGSQ